MVPRSRPEKKRGSSKQIVSAALRVFSEKGFAGGKVDEIARLAGLNKVTLYYHVGNKGALYQAAFQEAEKRLIAAMNQVPEGAVAPENRLEAILMSMAELFIESPDIPRMLLHEVAGGGSHLTADGISGFNRVLSILKRAYVETRESDTDQRESGLHTPCFILGGLLFCFAWAPLWKRLDPDRCRAEARDVFLRELGEV